MSKPASERRTLRMHPHLLWDVITKQAGTLEKAILEGVMNVIDAGATKCDIKIDETGFSIVDDGKGFVDETEITNFFETFGYPHKAGDARLGTYRMGRGQLFSFGVNDWASNTFRMHVDLKPQEHALDSDNGHLGYDFSAGHKKVNGCTISVKLYEPLVPSTVASTVRELTAYVKWVDIPVSINGKVVSKTPTAASWDEETPDAWIQVKDKGTLDVYNLGVLVCRIPSHRYGCGGTVVSKLQLQVNFARNDIQATCPVWKRVSKKLRLDQTKKNVQKPRLNDSERENLARQILSGELPIEEGKDIKILTDVVGDHHPISKLESLSARYSGRLSFAEIGDRVAETAHQRGLAFVLAKQTLDRFDATSVEDLIKALHRVVLARKEELGYQHGLWHLDSALRHVKVVKRKEFEKLFSSTHTPLKASELTSEERAILKTLDWISRSICWAIRRNDDPNKEWQVRKIHAGISDTATAWTDGQVAIWINRPNLKLALNGVPGAIRLVALLVHEYLHDDSDIATHVHDADFYRRHHDLMIDNPEIGEAVESLVKGMISVFKKEGKRPTGALARSNDRLFEGQRLGMGGTAPDLPDEPASETAGEPAESAEKPVGTPESKPAAQKKARKTNNPAV